MFIRPCYRQKNGKQHAYWALMESYRTERGPRQRVVAYLGRLDEAAFALHQSMDQGYSAGRFLLAFLRDHALFDDARQHSGFEQALARVPVAH